MPRPQIGEEITRHFEIRNKKLTKSDLIKLCSILDSLNESAKELEVDLLFKYQNDTSHDRSYFDSLIKDLFPIHVTIEDRYQNKIFGDTLKVFEVENFPDEIYSVFISTSVAFWADAKRDPFHKIVVLLDFRKPPAIDLINMPSHATQNNSHIEISGRDLNWVNGAYQRINDFFAPLSTNRTWLHRQGIYDVFVWFLIFPISVWFMYRVREITNISKLDDFIRVAIYILIFLSFTNIARMAFTYSKWMYPLMEYQGSDGSIIVKHRIIHGAIVSTLFFAFLYDLIKFLAT